MREKYVRRTQRAYAENKCPTQMRLFKVKNHFLYVVLTLLWKQVPLITLFT